MKSDFIIVAPASICRSAETADIHIVVLSDRQTTSVLGNSKCRHACVEVELQACRSSEKPKVTSTTGHTSFHVHLQRVLVLPNDTIIIPSVKCCPQNRFSSLPKPILAHSTT